jgi:hypothetical protein
MNFRLELICVKDDGTEERREVLTVAKEQLAMETLGLTLAEGKALLSAVQACVVEEQATAYLAQHRACATCGKPHRSKEPRRSTVNTVFGSVTIPNPRWHRCACQETGPFTFRPTAQWLTGHTSPDLLYLETKWASLIPYAKVVDLLQEVLPVAETLNPETVRQHVHATATKMEQALGEEKEELFDGTDDDWAAQPLPDGPMTIGLDGGFVRARRKAGFFEVIAGKSIVAFRRNEAEDIPSAKRFGFVQTYDTKPRRRLWELLKSQGMQENQAVLFLSDGGDTVRNLQTYLHPSSAHVIDWFHIAMKLTVLQQQNKAFIDETPEEGAHVAKTLERVNHYLWHGHVDKALECLGLLLFDLEAHRRRFPVAAKLERGVTEFDTYIRNNQKFIPNFGERYRQGDTISTAFVESTINQVVSKRFVKRQQMQWSQKGAHLLLQTRTKVLDGDLEGVFREWYPQFRPVSAASPNP